MNLKLKIKCINMYIKCLYIYIYVCIEGTIYVRGPGSFVGIATDYGLEGPGSNSTVCFETWWSAVVFTQGVSRPKLPLKQ